MKLIEILVQELPKRGGWPIDSDDERTLMASLPEVLWRYDGGLYYAFRGPDDGVNYKQYEAALASSKTEWDGESVPPVGTECEYSLNAGRTWFKCKIDYVLGTQGLIMLADVYEGGQFVGFAEYDGKLKFRPIRSEADKKREKGVVALATADPKVVPFAYGEKMSNGELIGSAWYDLYDAIAAGKVPGIKLED